MRVGFWWFWSSFKWKFLQELQSGCAAEDEEEWDAVHVRCIGSGRWFLGLEGFSTRRANCDPEDSSDGICGAKGRKL